MTDPIDTAADTTDDGPADIAWMRTLAQEGASAPLKGGSIMLATGLVFGVASLAHWAVASGLTPWSYRAFGIIWPVATAGFLLFLFLYGPVVRRRGGVRTAADRASSAVWSSVGTGIFFLFASMTVMNLRLGTANGEQGFWLVPSIIMVFYGLGWAVTAAMSRLRPLWGLSGASFLAAPAMAAFAGSANLYLAYAAALFALMALPGLLLMRAAKATRNAAV